MSKNRTTRSYTVSANTTHSLPVGEAATYLLTGSPNLASGSTTIQASGTPAEGMIVWMKYQVTPSNYNESSANITIFGEVVPSEIASKTFIAVSEYVSSAWNTSFLLHWGPGTDTDDLIATNMLQDDSVGNDQLDSTSSSEAVNTNVIRNNAVTLAKMQQMSANGFIGNDSGGAADPQHLSLQETRTLLGQSITLAGDVTSSNTTESAGTGVTTITTTIANDAVDSAQIASGAVGIDELATTTKTEMITFTASFEANEVGKMYIQVPFDCTVQEITATASKTIAGTDNGTLTLLNNGGASMTGGSITATASDAFGTTYSATVTANNTLSAGDTLDVATSKTTAGGRLLCVVKLLRT